MKIKFSSRPNFKILIIHKPFLGPWGHVSSHTKFGLDRFSRFDVYWTLANSLTDKQSIQINVALGYFIERHFIERHFIKRYFKKTFHRKTFHKKTFQRKTFHRKTFHIERHFIERYFIERHFIERHFIERHFIDNNIIDRTFHR